MNKKQYIGNDAGSRYTYQEPINLNKCYTCMWFYDNKYENRYECINTDCENGEYYLRRPI